MQVYSTLKVHVGRLEYYEKKRPFRKRKYSSPSLKWGRGCRVSGYQTCADSPRSSGGCSRKKGKVVNFHSSLKRGKILFLALPGATIGVTPLEKKEPGVTKHSQTYQMPNLSTTTKGGGGYILRS